MDLENYVLLGVNENATDEEIKEAYETLKAKYDKEKWEDGEVGTNAARMLTKVNAAYREIMDERRERRQSQEDPFEAVRSAIRGGDISKAQTLLDNFNERSAEWHYLQSVVFYRKNWMNESKKQLEIAMQLEPDNEKYREKYRILQENMKSSAAKENEGGAQDNGYRTRYDSQNMDGYPGQDQMGRGFCENCVDCCSTYLCLSCFCDSCCR